eukprot:gene45447-39894_t
MHAGDDCCILCFADQDTAEEVVRHFNSPEGAPTSDWRLKAVGVTLADLSFVYLGPFQDNAPLLPPKEQTIIIKRTSTAEKWGFIVDSLCVLSVSKDSPAGKAGLTVSSVVLKSQGMDVMNDLQ